MRKVAMLANDFVTVYESPNPERIIGGTPGLARLGNGRLVATVGQMGPGVGDLPGVKGRRGDGRGVGACQGRIYTSDDRGTTWTARGLFPFVHARPFSAGKSVYILGHDGDLCVMRSDDNGATWSETVRLTAGQNWHQSACNVHYAHGRIYLVMERRVYSDFRGWPVSELAPVLMSAPVEADLTRRENWMFASELAFRDIAGRPSMVGVPFWRVGATAPEDAADRRPMAEIGWLETNVVQFVDADHLWCDPTGHTFHLWMRAHTGGTGLACIAKVVEAADGSMQTMLETAPSGEPMLFVPCPGGQMRFHILYDGITRLYWLLSTLATDSMTRPDRLPPGRYNLPNNERQIMALHFSRNCIDWCMAGVVARGGSPKEARHYASMVIDGDDLHVLSRSGDSLAKSAHDGNLTTFHTVRGFRELVYI